MKEYIKKSLAEVELNPQQQALLDKYHNFFRNQALTAPLDILHGAGGTGKTTIARLLQKLSKMYGDNVSTSIMGVACNQLGGGAVTIDSILLPRHHKSKKQSNKKIDDHGDSGSFGNSWLSPFEEINELTKLTMKKSLKINVCL